MEYAVPDERMDEAMDLLDIYRQDKVALDLLHEFYSFLPDAVEDWIREIRLVNRKRGMFLLAAMTQESGYLYLISSEGVEFHGSLQDGLWDRELLDFFGYEDRDSFRKMSSTPDKYQVYEPMDSDIDICPACHVESGELHELGCPVELCPWCGGQLIQCSCRFDKLEVDALETERDLIRFEELLHEKGRIAYSPEQRPSFVDEGPGIIIE